MSENGWNVEYGAEAPEWPISLFLAALLFAASGGAEAQQVTALSGGPTCETCTIRLDTVAIIGDTEGPGQVREQSRVWAAPDGSFFIASNWEPGIIKLFDQSGTFVTQFGGPGSRAGEYTIPQVVPAADLSADLFHVFDRLHVSSVDSTLQLIDTKNLPFIPSFAERLNRSQFVLFAIPTTAEHIGLPLHLYDHERGQIIRSFGALSERVTMSNRGSARPHTIALSGKGAVWLAPQNRYRIERWSVNTGQLLSIIERDVSWFPNWEHLPPGTVLTRPPTTMLWRVSEDEQSRLWTIIHTASAGWRPQEPAIRRGEHAYISDAQNNQVYDSVIEVISNVAESPEVFASGRIPGRILGVAGANMLYMFDEDSAGSARYLILRPSVSSDDARANAAHNL